MQKITLSAQSSKLVYRNNNVSENYETGYRKVQEQSKGQIQDSIKCN